MNFSHHIEVGLKESRTDGLRSRQCSGTIPTCIRTLVPCVRQARWSPAVGSAVLQPWLANWQEAGAGRSQKETSGFNQNQDKQSHFAQSQREAATAEQLPSLFWVSRWQKTSFTPHCLCWTKNSNRLWTYCCFSSEHGRKSSPSITQQLWKDFHS